MDFEIIDISSFVLVPIALALSFFIETSSWWLRIEANKENVGLFISRSNIYLYGGRFFALIFGVLLAFRIESGTHPKDISFLLATSFFVSFIFQATLLSSVVRLFVIRLLSFALKLPKPKQSHIVYSVNIFEYGRFLFFSTLIASVSFSMGISMPMLLASIFIDNRLVFANVGQLINALGMIFMLFFVDQKLYAALDNGSLFSNLIVYTQARLLSFLLVSFVFLLISTVT